MYKVCKKGKVTDKAKNTVKQSKRKEVIKANETLPDSLNIGYYLFPLLHNIPILKIKEIS